MGKAREQKQKEYHERLEEKDSEKYLKDARERKNRNYISLEKIWVEQRQRKEVLLLENV